MTSTRQLAANRRNAFKSTGPRTAAGKIRSRYNAKRHGFNAQAADSPAEKENTARMVAMIHVKSPEEFADFFAQQAKVIAASQALLDRIRAARLRYIEGDVERQGGSPKVNDVDGVIGDGVPRYLLDNLRNVLPLLLSLERYDRRASSRRRKAISVLRTLQSSSNEAAF